MVPRSLAVLLALAVSGCVYPGAVTGSAPVYQDGYQPVMGGYASEWPAQPGALWGPEDVPNVDVFFEPLARHGRWVQTQWGRAFQPAAPQGWRPYQNGQWLDNRFWLSADPWGWATDHYGRWGFDQSVGWVWVPGTNWGPSWVAWREADEVVGWAPIPPQIAWSVGFGFGNGWGFDNFNSWYGPSWVWVPRGNLYVSRFGGGILPWNVGLNYWGRSRWQHAPYWGWNQPWDRGWGWRAPGYGAGRGYQYGGRNPGWNNGYGRSGQWNRGDGRRDGWNGPRRGAPGSVGDRIGRDMTGQPQRPPGWTGSGRPDGQRGDGWRGDGRNGTAVPGDRPQRGDRPPRSDRYTGSGVSGAVAGAMAPPPQMRPPAQPQTQPPAQQRPAREYAPAPRSEPAGDGGSARAERREANRQAREDGGRRRGPD